MSGTLKAHLKSIVAVQVDLLTCFATQREKVWTPSEYTSFLLVSR